MAQGMFFVSLRSLRLLIAADMIQIFRIMFHDNRPFHFLQDIIAQLYPYLQF